MRITHEIGQWIGLTDDNGIERLCYDYASAPKPFIHPLRLPDGTTITEHEPADHTWHRGLWFAFKFVNGINYWEERDEIFGYQKTLHVPHAILRADRFIQTYSHVSWEDRGEERIGEHRDWRCGFLEDGATLLKWRFTLGGDDPQDITLDRTPFTTWGGYGGLFVRLKNDLENPRLVFDDGTVTTRCTGERYKWGGIEGTTPDGKDCAVVFLPSPENTRYPEPFYGAAKTDYNFFGPAPLFHEPIVLKNGETFTYQVKVLVLPRRINPDEINTYL
ncbi:MAG: PmoA family protein [Armatimonadetes bacterium]|nr:PmoA family protein [Armatimonadota bacterium]